MWVDAPDPAAVPGPITRGCAGRVIHLRRARRSPRALLIDEVLAGEECDALIRIAAPRASRLAASTTGPVLGGDPRHADAVDIPLAGADLNAYERACRDHVDDRLHALFDWPRDAGLPLRVARSVDAWPRATAGSRGASAVVATLVCWLHVPRRSAWAKPPGAGLAIAPRRGFALFLRHDVGTEGGGAYTVAAIPPAATDPAPDPFLDLDLDLDLDLHPAPPPAPIRGQAPDFAWIATKCFTCR